jgi:hypothetical protein
VQAAQEQDKAIVRIIRTGFRFGPILFGLLFIPPVTAQIIAALGIVPPFGLMPLASGFLIGGIWGAFAQVSGSWVTWRV